MVLNDCELCGAPSEFTRGSESFLCCMTGRRKERELTRNKRVETAIDDIAYARESGLVHTEISTASDMEKAYSTLKCETARLSLSLREALSDLPEDILEYSDIIPFNSLSKKLERVVLIAGSIARHTL